MRPTAVSVLWLRITERVDLLICPAHAPGLVPGHHVPDVQGVRSACLAAPVDVATTPGAWLGGCTPVGDGGPPVRPLQQGVPCWMARHTPPFDGPRLLSPVDDAPALSAPPHTYAPVSPGWGLPSPLVRASRGRASWREESTSGRGMCVGPRRWRDRRGPYFCPVDIGIGPQCALWALGWCVGVAMRREFKVAGALGLNLPGG
jgi:hypothetical protein